jgi:hypothetical protein
MRVVKLTRQYSGFGQFSHRIEIRSTNPNANKRQWVEIRNWLWSQFGPSAELFLATPEFFDGNQPKWAWDSDKSVIYITDEAYTMFMLKKEYYENL